MSGISDNRERKRYKELLTNILKQYELQREPHKNINEKAFNEQFDLEKGKLNNQWAGRFKAREQKLSHAKNIHKAQIWGLFLLFALVVGWLTVICFFVYCSGKGVLELPSSVIISLIGATTINVVSLFSVAATWLYQKKTRRCKCKQSTKRKRNRGG